jgi:hypothetical protein
MTIHCPVVQPEHWQVTAAEIASDYPCDHLAQTAVRALTRGIDVDAPVPVTFRWLCQLRVAPTATTGSTTWAGRAPARSRRDSISWQMVNGY